jgi:hypothetical protein
MLVYACFGARYLAADLVELLGGIRESSDLGRAHEGEVKRVEEEDKVLSLGAD